MGFQANSWAKIWSVENKGKYSTCNLSVSRKNKQSGQYEIEFQDGYVRLVGTAHEKISGLQIPENGLSIRISSCDVTNKYNADKKQLYVNYVIFGLELSSEVSKNDKPSKSSGKKTKESESEQTDTEDDGGLPF